MVVGMASDVASVDERVVTDPPESGGGEPKGGSDDDETGWARLDQPGVVGATPVEGALVAVGRDVLGGREVVGREVVVGFRRVVVVTSAPLAGLVVLDGGAGFRSAGGSDVVVVERLPTPVSPTSVVVV